MFKSVNGIKKSFAIKMNDAKRLVSVVIVGLFIVSFDVCIIRAENLVTNGDFEIGITMPEEWAVTSAGDPGSINYDDRARGNKCISLSSTKKALCIRQGGIPLDTNKEYTLSAEIKTEELSVPAYVCVINNGWTWSVPLNPEPSNNEWQKYETTFMPAVSSNGIYQVVVYMAPNTSGKMSVDNISLVEKGDTAVESKKLQSKLSKEKGSVLIRPHTHSDKIIIKLIALVEGSKIELELKPSQKKEKLFFSVDKLPENGRAEVTVPIEKLVQGDYEISAKVIDSAGKQIGEVAKEKFNCMISSGMKILNNFVIEIINSKEEVSGERVYSFVNPREGWVFFYANFGIKGTGSGIVLLDDTKQIIAKENLEDSDGKKEAMRYLSSGLHKIKVNTEKCILKELVIRAIPEIAFCRFGYEPHIKPYGPYDWNFLKRVKILDNVNVIVGTDPNVQSQYMEQWHSEGKKWILERPIGTQRTVEECYQSWTKDLGHRLVDGVIVDEFAFGTKVHTEAAEKLHQEYPQKTFYPYCNNSLTGKEFCNTVVKNSGKFSVESYLPEQPTEQEGKDYIEQRFRFNFLENYFTDSRKYLIACLGIFSIPPCSLNIDPQVDYKVWLDMQINFLANEPSIFGLYGISDWTCGYADEETIRWLAKLYRHYCIEGNRDLLSREYGFSYTLIHIENPDFEKKGEGWDLSPAEEGSIQFGKMDRLSEIMGRYPKTTKGNDYLLTCRSSKAPNYFSQKIKNLKPGKLYSLKMFATDMDKQNQKLAVSIKIEDVDLIPEKCFQYVGRNWIIKDYLNYFYYVFRAKKENAKVTISDWSDKKEPGGPIDQKIMYNFIEIQPYLED